MAECRQNCGTLSDKIYDNYHITFNTTYSFFDYVLKNVKTPNFRFLIYNGDVDTVCNYLGDAWHMRDVAQAANLKSSPRQSWFFSRNNQVAGFYQRLQWTQWELGANVTIDVLTVKVIPGFVLAYSIFLIWSYSILQPRFFTYFLSRRLALHTLKLVMYKTKPEFSCKEAGHMFR
ncbi:hypothetical protein COOONC_09258 [Cooperia oncophora]